MPDDDQTDDQQTDDQQTDPPPPPEHWTASLDGEMANHPGLKKFKDPTAAAKGYIEMEKAFSAQGVRVPGEDASEEQVAAYREAIGVPKTPEEYDVTAHLELPEGMDWDGKFQEDMLQTMHGLGMTPAQVNGVMQKYVGQQTAAFEAEMDKLGGFKEAATKHLKSEWGSSYQGKIKLADDVMTELFGDQKTEVATLRLSDGSLLGQNPLFVKAMAKVGDDYTEHDIHGMGQRARMTMTPEEAAAELVKLDGDEAFQKSLWDKADPGHEAAVERRMALYAMKMAGQES